MARIGMLTALALLATAAAVAVPAQAQEGGPVRVEITPLDCRPIDQGVAFNQAPGVEYQPGVDVAGRPVAPADVGGGYAIDLPEEIAFYIDLDMIERIRDRLPATAGKGLKGEATLGAVSIRDGIVMWNGEPMEPSVQRELREACRKLQAQRHEARQRRMQMR